MSFGLFEIGTFNQPDRRLLNAHTSDRQTTTQRGGGGLVQAEIAAFLGVGADARRGLSAGVGGASDRLKTGGKQAVKLVLRLAHKLEQG